MFYTLADYKYFKELSSICEKAKLNPIAVDVYVEFQIENHDEFLKRSVELLSALTIVLRSIDKLRGDCQ